MNPSPAYVSYVVFHIILEKHCAYVKTKQLLNTNIHLTNFLKNIEKVLNEVLSFQNIKKPTGF